jgi:hypothetical protein
VEFLLWKRRTTFEPRQLSPGVEAFGTVAVETYSVVAVVDTSCRDDLCGKMRNLEAAEDHTVDTLLRAVVVDHVDHLHDNAEEAVLLRASEEGRIQDDVDSDDRTNSRGDYEQVEKGQMVVDIRDDRTEEMGHSSEWLVVVHADRDADRDRKESTMTAAEHQCYPLANPSDYR